MQNISGWVNLTSCKIGEHLFIVRSSFIVVKSPFKYFHSGFLSLNPLPWPPASFCGTFLKHTLICPWTVKVKWEERVPGEPGYLFSLLHPSLLTLESWRVPDFLTHILGASCCGLCNCNSINMAALWLSASLTCETERETEVGMEVTGPKDFQSQWLYSIQGNTTFWTAGLQQWGVIMIYHPVVQFAVQSSNTHPNSPPAPLNLHPGYISLTQLWGCVMWNEPALPWKSALIFKQYTHNPSSKSPAADE